jgi:hypothetical protein
MAKNRLKCHAKATDPTTSHEAAKAADLGKVRAIINDCIRVVTEKGPIGASAEEIAKEVPHTYHDVHRQLKKTMPFLFPAGEKRPNANGRRVQVWVAAEFATEKQEAEI